MSLDFDTGSKRISNFGGVVKLSDVRVEHIFFPKNIVKGILYVSEERGFMRGGSWRFEFAEKYLFDAEQSLFQVEKYSANKPCCRFLKNSFCQLNAQGNLKCLLISNIKFTA